jgi:hypothetical protein
MTAYRNEVTSLGRGKPIVQSIGLLTTKTDVGSTIGRFFGFVSDGLYQSEDEIDRTFAPAAAPGDVRYRDLDGDGRLTDNDRTYIGSPLPAFTYGFSANSSFKGFDLSLLFYGVQGNDVVNGYYPRLSTYFNSTAIALDRWTPENTDTNIPRAVFGDPNGNDRFSNRFVEDGSYLRLRNVTLGYTLPAALTSRIKMSGIRVYVSGQNLFTLSNYSGYDPEVAGGSGVVGYTFYGASNLTRGYDWGIFPSSRTLLGGLQINF